MPDLGPSRAIAAVADADSIATDAVVAAAAATAGKIAIVFCWRQVGEDVDIEQAAAAARVVAINLITTMKGTPGSVSFTPPTRLQAG